MKQQPFSRRSLLQGTLAGGLAAAPYIYSRGAAPTPEALTGKSLREPIRSRVIAGRGTILAELKPTPKQLEHGLELHHDAYVADLMGAVYVAAAIGQPGPRLQHMLAWNRKELEAEGVDPREASRLVRRTWWNHKPLESAFENGWQEDWKALYELTGLDLAVEDNAGHYTFDQCLRWMATSNLAYGRLPDVVRIAGAKDLRKARSQGKLGLLSQLQGVHALWVPGKSVEHLDLFYGLGVRMAQLSHTHSNAVAWDAYQLWHRDPGLSREGRQLVLRMNELGVAVDLSHAARRTALDAAETSQEPVINSHTACTAVYRDIDQRNVDDDYLRVVAGKGGLIGIYIVDHRLWEQGDPANRSKWNSDPPRPATFEQFARHLEHAVKVAGIDHVGIGTDLTYIPNYSARPMEWSNWPYWTVGLVARGFSDEEIRKILGGNALRFLERVLDKKPWGAYGPG